MGLRSLGSPFYYGSYYPYVLPGAAVAFNTSLVLNADTDKGALCFVVPETVTVSKVSFGTGTITTGSTGVRIQFETLSVAGLPTGTLYHANATVDVGVANGDDDTWKGDNAFGGNFTLTAGDKVALLIKRVPGNTFNGIIGRIDSGSAGQMPFSMNNLTGADVKIANSLRMGLELSSGAKWYLPGLYPFSATAVATFNSGSNPDEKGMQFRLPFRARIVGVWWHGLAAADAAAAVTYTAAIYSGTTSQASVTVDNDVNQDNTEGRHSAFFTAPFTASAGTDYICAIQPGSVNVAIREFTLPAAAWMAATPYVNTNSFGVNRVNAGSWSSEATILRLCGPIIDQIDTGSPGRADQYEFGRRGVLVG